MRLAVLLALGALVVPGVASAHPHPWISQQVRVVAKDGKYTHVEIEWQFDPEASEDEIPAIDEDKDGKFSAEEIRMLVRDMMPGIRKAGFMTWLNTGGKDFRPAGTPGFAARIDDPPSFTPADWNRVEGHRDGTPMPARSFSITTYDAGDFMRFEVDRTKLPAGCRLSKHPTCKSEFVPGHPVFADTVSCKLP